MFVVGDVRLLSLKGMLSVSADTEFPATGSVSSAESLLLKSPKKPLMPFLTEREAKLLVTLWVIKEDTEPTKLMLPFGSDTVPPILSVSGNSFTFAAESSMWGAMAAARWRWFAWG